MAFAGLTVLVVSGCAQQPAPNTAENQSQTSVSTTNATITITPTQSATQTNSQLVMREAKYKVIGEEVNYFDGAKGYWARPEGDAKYPGVVMIHEWWGLNDYIKSMSRELAGQGYSVMAVDLYQGKVGANADEARALVGKVGADQATATGNLKAAAQYLKSHGSAKVGSLGWCFGGGQSLQLALSGEKLDGTVIYYGQLVTDAAKLAPIQWPVLGIFGDKDTSVTPESAKAFDAALTAANIEHEVKIYSGLGHAFANPSGAGYAPTETKDAWDKTLNFLGKNLR